jgi:hypothetical protein
MAGEAEATVKFERLSTVWEGSRHTGGHWVTISGFGDAIIGALTVQPVDDDEKLPMLCLDVQARLFGARMMEVSPEDEVPAAERIDVDETGKISGLF